MLQSTVIVLVLAVFKPVYAERPAEIPPDVVKSWSNIIGDWEIENMSGAAIAYARWRK